MRQKITLNNFFNKIYLPYIEARKRSWKIDRRVYRLYVEKSMGIQEIGGIKRAEIEDWLTKLKNSGIAPVTCNRYLAVVRGIFSLAEQREVLSAGKSPCRGIKKFHTPPNRERYLSSSEAQKLFAFLGEHNAPQARVIKMLMLTGARKSEILNARWTDINFEQQILVIPLSKSGKKRFIQLSPGAIAILNEQRTNNLSEWVFPNKSGRKPLPDIFMYWDKTRKKLGLDDVRLHDLRHSFASFLVNSGCSLYQTQTLLGHANPAMTMRYAHLDRNNLVGCVKKVEEILACPR